MEDCRCLGFGPLQSLNRGRDWGPWVCADLRSSSHASFLWAMSCALWWDSNLPRVHNLKKVVHTVQGAVGGWSTTARSGEPGAPQRLHRIVFSSRWPQTKADYPPFRGHPWMRPLPSFKSLQSQHVSFWPHLTIPPTHWCRVLYQLPPWFQRSRVGETPLIVIHWKSTHPQCPAVYKVFGQIPVCLKFTSQTKRSRGISQQFAWYKAGRDRHDDTLCAISAVDVPFFTRAIVVERWR